MDQIGDAVCETRVGFAGVVGATPTGAAAQSESKAGGKCYHDDCVVRHRFQSCFSLHSGAHDVDACREAAHVEETMHL